MGLLGDRNQHELTFLHSFDFALRNPQFVLGIIAFRFFY
jgi:hypothetical protein